MRRFPGQSQWQHLSSMRGCMRGSGPTQKIVRMRLWALPAALIVAWFFASASSIPPNTTISSSKVRWKVWRPVMCCFNRMGGRRFLSLIVPSTSL